MTGETQSRIAIAADGARIAYRSYGRGAPTVLLSNGIGCNQAYTDHLVRALASRYRTVIWDYRGHVDSDPPSGPEQTSVAACLRDLEAVVGELGGGDLVLAGFSMGVQISLEAYLRLRDRTRGLLLLLGTFEFPLRSFFHAGPLWERIAPGVLAAGRSWPEALRASWRTLFAGPWLWPAARLLVLNAQAARREDFESWQIHLSRMAPETFLQMAIHLGQHSAASALPQIDVPCLIVAGDRDNFTPLEVIERMHARIAGSELAVIEGASHGGLFEFAEQVNARVLSFMAEHFDA
ncbi:MAG: alpha/beta hydrolase [Deltaproteobacteria bacterium]|nr:alpha/beta hydrolase [Deltaproteobacteria bacterium]